MLLAAIVVVQTLVAWLYARGSYFSYDDFTLFSGFRHGAGVDLLASNGGHLNPGYRVLHKLVYLGWRPHYQLSLELMLAFHAASSVLLQRVLSRIYGDAWWTFALALGFGVSIINLTLFLEFTWSSTYVPALTFSLAAIHAHLVWLQGGRREWLIWSVVSIPLGLLFYEAVVLVPIVIALMWVFLLEPDLSVVDAARATARAWRVWALYALPIAVFAILLASGSYAQRTIPSLGPLLDFLGTAWTRGFGGGIFGIFVGLGPDSTLESIGIVCAQIALLGVIVWSIARRRFAWRAWAWFAISFFLGVFLVSPRLRDFEPAIGANLRYVAQATYLFPLALAFAFAQPRRPGEAVALSPPRGLRLVAFTAVAASIAALSVFGALASRRDAQGPKVGAWVANLRHDVKQVRARGQEPSLLDARPPDFVVPGFAELGPKIPNFPTSISEITGLIGPRLRYDPSRPPVFAVQPDGRLQPVRFVASSDEPMLTAVKAGRALGGPGHIDRKGRFACMTAGPLGGGMLEYRPVRALRGRDWFLSVEVRGTAPLLDVSTDRGVGYTPADRYFATGPGRPGNVSVMEVGGLPTGVPTFAGIRIAVPKSSTACFGRVRVGAFLPGGTL